MGHKSATMDRFPEYIKDVINNTVKNSNTSIKTTKAKKNKLPDNVVLFPKINKNDFSHLVKDDKNKNADITVELRKRMYVEELTNTYAIFLASKLAQEGFDTNSEAFNKNFSFTVENLKSTILATIGIHHPLQKIVEDVVELK